MMTILGIMTITYQCGDDIVEATGEGVPSDGPFASFVVLKNWTSRGYSSDDPISVTPSHLCIATKNILTIRCNVHPTFQVDEDVVIRSTEMRDIMFEHEYQQHQNNTETTGAWE